MKQKNFTLGGFCLGAFVLGGFCRGVYVRGVFVLEPFCYALWVITTSLRNYNKEDDKDNEELEWIELF